MTWKVATAKKGQRSPPPLPMYERVVLKHVPTMVRRRYDRDLNIIDENEGKGEDDEAGDLDDSFDDYEEAEDDSHASLDTEYDSQSSKGNYGGNNIESSSSSCSKDYEDENDGAKEEDLVRYVEASVGNEAHENEQDCKSKGEEVEDANISVQGDIQDMEDQNFDDKQVQDYLDSKERKEEDDRANDVVVSNYMDVSVKNDVQGVEQEDDKSEGDGIEDNRSDLASDYKDGSVQDELQGNQHLVNFDNQQGSCIENFQSEGDGFKDNVNNVASDYVDTNLSNAQDKEQGSSDDNNNDLSEEDVKSEGDGGGNFLPSTTSSDVDDDSGDDEARTKPTLNTELDTQTYANVDFQPNDKFESSTNIQSEEINSEDGVENDQDTCSKDVVEEEDGTAGDLKVKIASDMDTSIKTELEHHEQGLHMEDCKIKVGGTKDDGNALGAIFDELDTSVENEVKHHEPENDGSKQGLCSKDAEVVEDDRAIDIMNLASDVDASVKIDEAEHDEQGHVEDCESEGGEGKDVNDVASYNVDEGVKQEVLKKGHLKEHENLDNKPDLIPEAFVKTLEQEGYELCCPNCKHYITHTMIFRRRNDDQQFKTTCFSFLISLFCCK